MKKKIIILILPMKLREIDIQRFDINEIEKKLKIKVQIHEVINFIWPGFEKAFLNTIRDKRLKSFKSFNLWKKYFKKLIENYTKILVINLVDNNNITSLN